MRYDSTTFSCDICGTAKTVEAGQTPPGWDCHGDDDSEEGWDLCTYCVQMGQITHGEWTENGKKQRRELAQLAEAAAQLSESP